MLLYQGAGQFYGPFFDSQAVLSEMLNAIEKAPGEAAAEKA